MPTRGDYRATMMATDNRSPQTLISGSDQISLLIGSVILTKVWILGISFQTVFCYLSFLLGGGWFFETPPPFITWVELLMSKFGLSQIRVGLNLFYII